MISKQEYIALREQEAAYCAVLYSLNKNKFEFDIVETKKVRELAQKDTGFPFSELAIGKALGAPDPYSFARQVSGDSDIGSFKLDIEEAKRKFHYLSLAEASLVWQLLNVNHEGFRARVARIRKDASARYEIDKNYQNPFIGAWGDINLQMMDGMFQASRGSRSSSLRKSDPSSHLFSRGAMKAEWIAVYIGLAGLVISLWIGGKI